MLWLKAIHLIFMVTWFAGLFYLPRLFVYHAMSDDQTSIERFKIMERNTSQDYKDLANSVKQFMKKHISPEILDERRECMFDLENLMTGIENKLKKGNSPAE